MGPWEAPGAAGWGPREGVQGGACGDRRGFLQASVAQPSVCLRPQTRHPSPFKNKNKYLCCMLCVLGFSFPLEAKNRCISASLQGFLPPRPTPRCARAWPGALGLVPSFDLTASDRGKKVSEDDYGMKVPITAAQEASPRRPATPRWAGGRARGTHPSPDSHHNHPPAFQSKRTTITQPDGGSAGHLVQSGASRKK